MVDEWSPSDAMRRMLNGFRVSQLLHLAAALGLVEILKDGPRSIAEVAQATRTHAPTLGRLLRALATIGVLAEEPDDRFSSTPLADCLREMAPGSVYWYAMLIGQPAFWATWGQLLHTVRTGEPAFRKVHGMDLWACFESDPGLEAIFNKAMAQASGARAAAIVASYDFSGVGTLVDVGGGHGALIATILAAYPTMRGVLFDRPRVATAAGDFLSAAGLAGRCLVVGGNFFESVSDGGDAYLLKSIISDWDDGEAISVLRNCRGAIKTDGRLLVVERVVSPGAEAGAAKFNDLFMLAIVGGRERSVDEFAGLFAAAGFRLARMLPTSTEFSVIEGIPI